MSESMHLSDYFKSGEEFVLETPDPMDPDKSFTFRLWLQKPNPIQQEEATKKARAKQARTKRRYREEDSDEFLSLKEEIDQLGDVEELIDTLSQVDASKLRQQAYQEVLYADEEMRKELGTSDWGVDGAAYLDLLGGIRDRYDEISKANESLSEEDQHLRVNFEEDRELQLLQAEEEKFQEETNKRAEHLIEQGKAELRGFSKAALQEKLFKRMVDTEAGMAWLQEYRMLMLFFACRKAESHNSFYFKDVDKLWDLPDHVRTQLMDAYNELDAGLDDLKNSLSLLRS